MRKLFTKFVFISTLFFFWINSVEAFNLTSLTPYLPGSPTVLTGSIISGTFNFAPEQFSCNASYSGHPMDQAGSRIFASIDGGQSLYLQSIVD